MSIFASAAADSLNHRLQSDSAAARRVSQRRTVPQGPNTGRAEDELDLSVENAMTARAVRGLTGNADQQTQEDRQQSDNYRPATAKPTRPALDVQG